MMKRILTAAIIAVVAIAATIARAERADIYVERGTSYTLLYSQGQYIVGFGSAAPAIRGAFGTTGHVIPDNGLFFRTDLGTFYSASGGTLSASSFAGQTFTTTTLTSPTITTPTITSPTVTGDGSGLLVVKRCTITENASAISYTCSIDIPAGAVVEDIQVIGRVLWNGTSASMDVGDAGDADGFFATINLKATDLVIGEMLSVKHGDLWGGQEGVYLVAATGRRGPTTTNFSLSYVGGTTIAFVVTEGAADGTAGRTDCVVIYSVPQTVVALEI